VIAATTAREAFEAIERSDFDVVFCDLIMPGAGGIDLYERLRSVRPGLERRIVFMTGGAFTSGPRSSSPRSTTAAWRSRSAWGLVEQIVREMAGTGAAHGAEATKVAR